MMTLEKSYRVIPWFFLLVFHFYSSGQTIELTFSAKGIPGKVDSVMASNLTTGKSVTISGTEALVLSPFTAISGWEKPAIKPAVVPNPCKGEALLLLPVSIPQKARVGIWSLSGQEISAQTRFLESGMHTFRVTFGSDGISLAGIMDGSSARTMRVVSTGHGKGDFSLTYQGTTAMVPHAMTPSFQAGWLKSGNILGFTPGDRILMKCFADSMATVMVDIPETSRQVEVSFYQCRDRYKRHYATVAIGNQVWMAENLATLPAVSKPADGSKYNRHYYVYAFDGTRWDSAAMTQNYMKYGVLYNWPAAVDKSGDATGLVLPVRGICPAGWHLPSDEEWMEMEKYLGMDAAEASLYGLRNSGEVGKKLKSASPDWKENGRGINGLGFTIEPAGLRKPDGSFANLGAEGWFWTATQYGTSNSWSRSAWYNQNAFHRGTPDRSSGCSVRCIKD